MRANNTADDEEMAKLHKRVIVVRFVCADGCFMALST